MEQAINEAIEKLENNELSLNDLLDILTNIQLIIA
jgi:exonuclease VII small subunit